MDGQSGNGVFVYSQARYVQFCGDLAVVAKGGTRAVTARHQKRQTREHGRNAVRKRPARNLAHAAKCLPF